MRIAPLILATVLQLAPLCRRSLLGHGVAGRRSALVIWVAGAIALLGSYDAVSGASAAISGVVKYVGTTAVGGPTNQAVETAGFPFRYRITVSNPGTDFEKNYFNCYPLPPGLSINTNAGAAGYITGTPAALGTFPVTLVAGNLNYATPATLPATIVIYPASTAPFITNAPADLSIVLGNNATFRVGAVGSLPMNFQWLRGGIALPGRTASELALTNVASTDVATYQVAIANGFGSVTSSIARLTLRDTLAATLRIGSPLLDARGLRFEITGPPQTNFIIWGSRDARNWSPLRTNWVIDGHWQFTDPDAPRFPARLYRATFGGP